MILLLGKVQVRAWANWLTGLDLGSGLTVPVGAILGQLGRELKGWMFHLC